MSWLPNIFWLDWIWLESIRKDSPQVQKLCDGDWWFLINHWSPISKNSLKQSVYCVYCIYYLGGTHFPLQALINNFLAIHGAAISQYVFKHVGCFHEVVYLHQGILLSKLKGTTWLNPKPETTQTYLK